MTTSENPSPPNPIVTSDIPAPSNDWLEEPTLPKKEDYTNPENFEFAFNEYKRKMGVYEARIQLKKACDEIEEEKAKDVFKCFQGKHYPCSKDFCPIDDAGNPTPFKTATVAEWIAGNEKFKTDIATGIMYFFNGKCWIANAEPYLEKIISMILREENRQSHQQNIIQSLRPLTYDNIIFSKKLALPNGLLDPETQELTPNTPDEMPFFYIPTEYEPNTPCPQWQAWLNETMPSKEDQMTLQEWSGYILLPDYRFHKLLYNYGVGRNGKGTWERTIQAVIGKNNCSEVGLEELDGTHRFALFQLHGKLFNSCSEPTTNKILQTSILKKATGQDVISSERKGSDKRVEFTNTAKITISANKFPKVKDSSTAFVERRLFLTWNAQYLEGSNQIQWIERNWIQGEHDERKGILCWMLEGLKRLLQQGHFTTSKSQQETEIAFQRASDTIGAFWAELAIYGKNYATTRADALKSYEDYCEIYGLVPENDKTFTQRMEDNEKISKGKLKGDRAWKGVTFKKLNEDGTEGTDGTHLTCFLPTTNLDENPKNIEGIKRVPSVPSVLLLTDNLVKAKRFKPKAGVLCQQSEQDEQCPKEAEYSINGDLYCPTHFDDEKENQRKIRKIICAEWAEEAP